MVDFFSGSQWEGIVLTVQIAIAAAAALFAYFNRRWIVAFIEFRLRGRDFITGIVATDKPHIDIGGAQFDRELDTSNGVTVYDFDEEAEGIPLRCGENQKELLLFVVRYDHLAHFKPFVWWIHFWPPEEYQIIGPQLNETELPVPSDSSLHEGNALLLDEQRENGRYNNLAYAPMNDKTFTQLRRGSARFTVENYTSEHNVFMPVWVDMPDEPPNMAYMSDWEHIDEIEHDDPGQQKLTIVFDPPDLPVRKRKEIPLRFEDESWRAVVSDGSQRVVHGPLKEIEN